MGNMEKVYQRVT